MTQKTRVSPGLRKGHILADLLKAKCFSTSSIAGLVWRAFPKHWSHGDKSEIAITGEKTSSCVMETFLCKGKCFVVHFPPQYQSRQWTMSMTFSLPTLPHASAAPKRFPLFCSQPDIDRFLSRAGSASRLKPFCVGANEDNRSSGESEITTRTLPDTNRHCAKKKHFLSRRKSLTLWQPFDKEASRRGTLCNYFISLPQKCAVFLLVWPVVLRVGCGLLDQSHCVGYVSRGVCHTTDLIKISGFYSYLDYIDTTTHK